MQLHVGLPTAQYLLKTAKLTLLGLLSKNGRRKTAQNSIEVDAETKEGTRKTEENLDERNKRGHERQKPK